MRAHEVHQGDLSESDTDSIPSSVESADESSEGSSVGDEVDVEVPVVAGLPPVRPSIAAQRSGFAQLDHWSIHELFACRASVMRTVPRFLWGSFRVAEKVALDEVAVGQHNRNMQRQEQGWKLLPLLPRMFASTTKGRTDHPRQVDWQVRQLCSRSVGRVVARQPQMRRGCSDSFETPQAKGNQ